MMFHAGNNLYFGRLPDGSVRILKFAQSPVTWPAVNRYYSKEEGLLLDETVHGTYWPSIVASVSCAGETSDRFYTAQRFHQNPSNVMAEMPQTPQHWECTEIEIPRK